MLKIKHILIICLLIFCVNTSQSQIFPNGDFESGLNIFCECPTGYTCWNDAGRVVDSIHPLFSITSTGCVVDGVNYTSRFGAHSGTGYVYFYAGSDRVVTPDTLFVNDVNIELCVWYSGPRYVGTPAQNTSKAHFSFGVDGMQVGPDVIVPTGTNWKKYCYSVLVSAGTHNFCVMSGGSAAYSMWFDDFSVGVLCTFPIVDIGNDTTLCQGEILTLDASTQDATYLWHDNSTNPTFNVTMPGTYYVQVTDSCGTVTDTIEVNYNPLPNINLGGDTLLCIGGSLILNAATTGATYLWQDNSTASFFNITQQGTYWVHVTDSCGTVSDTINVSYTAPPIVDLGEDTTLCEGETLTLDVTTPFATYLWHDNSTNATYTVSTAGSYMVHITDTCGSTSTDVITITFNPLPFVKLGNDTIICDGEIITLDVTTQNATYIWQDNTTNPNFNVTQPGSYWVEVTVNDCSLTDTIMVDNLLPPATNFGNDTSICPGEVLILDATTPYGTYLWQDNSTNPTFDVSQQGTYWVEVINKCGIDSDTITIEQADCNCYIYIPNAFSPNGDNLNDYFSPKSNCDFSDYTLMIFNRWGEKLFETNDQYQPWNGRCKGKLSPIGVYVFTMKYKFEKSEEISKIGRVTLIH